MSWRGLATSTATNLGVLAALERLPTRPLLVVLAYHRVMQQADALYDPNVIGATPEGLDEQVTMLKKRHDLVGPEELLDLIDRPHTLRGIKVALTFDDGYIDNYEYVFPILVRHGIGAMFFVSTSFVGTGHLSWWDRAGYMIRHSRNESLELTLPRPTTIAIDRKRLPLTVRTVLRHLKSESGDHDRFLDDLTRATGVEPPEQADAPQFFSWEHAREMEKGGMMIGSHSHTHPILSNLGPAEQLEELTRSAGILKERGIGHPELFAYPVGTRISFNTASVDAVRAAGHRYAFSNYGGANRADRLDRFNIRRFGMDLGPDPTGELRARIAYAGLTAQEPW